jgi:hypothetical protein
LNPAHAEQIIEGAKTAFLHGDEWAYAAGAIAVAMGTTLVFFKYSKHDREKQLLASYKAEAEAEIAADADPVAAAGARQGVRRLIARLARQSSHLRARWSR